MYPQPAQCPVCAAELLVTRLHCRNCDTVIEGHFHAPVDHFENLSDEQVSFVLSFIRCEGRFNRLEEELGVSYPTLRNRLNEVVRALGFEPGKEEAQAVKVSADERMKILDDLAAGRISSQDAKELLRGRAA